MATKYLYGAAVQGIQNFILSTSKLKEIMGASELVELICTEMFDEYAGDGTQIIRAAGNIKFLFNRKADCERAVREFPRKAMEAAPGITISQAVVEFGDSMNFADGINKLEEKLRSQRNRPERSLLTGFVGIERSRRSGLPALAERVEGEFSDLSTKCKLEASRKSTLCEKIFGKNVDVSNHERLTGQNDWLAVIHADGNGLGQVVQKVGREMETFAEFSKKLDEATCVAAKMAFESLDDKVKNADCIPLRPIVLGGDDLTVVCRADLALPFVKVFMAEFEKQTDRLLGGILGGVFNGERRLTACAGVAFIKASYPFLYGYQLAEALCSQAKKDAKANLNDGELPQSCLSFYKVQDSFVESLEAMQKREQEPAGGHSFVFGPYYLQPKHERWTIDMLLDNAKQLSGDDKASNAVKSGLRRWMSAMHDGRERALQMRLRLLDVTVKKDLVRSVTDGEKRGEKKCYPVYDMLAVSTITNQKTK